MTKVIDFNHAKGVRMLRGLAWGPHNLDIAFEDVVRFKAFFPEGRNEDSIQLGKKAKPQVAKLFTNLGLPAMPRTWGELMGNLDYIQFLLFYAEAARLAKYPKPGSLQLVEQMQPTWRERVAAFLDGDIDRLRALHDAADTFQVNANEHVDEVYDDE